MVSLSIKKFCKLSEIFQKVWILEILLLFWWYINIAHACIKYKAYIHMIPTYVKNEWQKRMSRQFINDLD